MTCPDLRPYFEHIVERPMAHSFGVPVISDWSDKADDDPVFGAFKQCGFWTRPEAAILYEAALTMPRKPYPYPQWLDIGAHTGWTTAHLIAAFCQVDSVDPMFRDGEFWLRFRDNVRDIEGEEPAIFHCTSDEFFAMAQQALQTENLPWDYDGVVIDGDHDHPHPLHDAQNAAKFLKTTGVIMLHDAIGAPVQDAVAWLRANGFQAKIYLTPHVVACCWRGECTPPAYEPDPLVRRALTTRLPDWMLACA